MLAPPEALAARAVLYAVEDFMEAAMRLTRRSLHQGAKLDAARFEVRKKGFARSKEALLDSIKRIDPESELGRNIEKLFSTPGFVEVLEAELMRLKDEKNVGSADKNIDPVKMAGLSSERQVLEFEAGVLHRLNLSEYWISKLTREEVDDDQ
jgi:hypothetical protein